MGTDSKLDLRCPDVHDENYDLDFKSYVDTVAKKFPEKIDLPLLSVITTTFPVRAVVKSFLEAVLAPTLEATFEVEGDCDDIEAITIENTDSDLINTSSGAVQVMNVGVSYEFEVKVQPGLYKTVDCTCGDGSPGKRRARTFRIKWYIKISVNPGVGGKYPIDTFDLTVRACCCCKKDEGKKKDEGEKGGTDEQEKLPSLKPGYRGGTKKIKKQPGAPMKTLRRG